MFFHSQEYYQVKHTPGLWRNVWKPISFTLIVDNFVIGYFGQEHVDHMMSALKKYYEKSTADWEGKLQCGITMKWNYTKGMQTCKYPCM